jgi:hypothetical protein
MADRYLCRDCGWTSDEGEPGTLSLIPLGIDRILTVCPDCREVETTLARACDEPGCDQEASMGTPVPGGYRSTCWQHRPADSGERARGEG